jgi:hypothetical protein
MSSLCQASHSILAIQDKDVALLNSSSWDPFQHENLVRRDIDVKLDCKFTADDSERSNCKLEVLDWKHGATDLCGCCPFCNLLVDSIQLSLDSNALLDYACWTSDLRSFPRPFALRGLLHFETLKYQNHRIRQGFHSVRSKWGFSLMLLTGWLIFNPKNNVMDLIRDTKVDVAFELFGEENNPAVELLKIHRRPIHGPRLSDENVSKIRDWIKNCDENHDRCSLDSMQLDSKEADAAMTFLPARLIDVGDGLNQPRLVLTSTLWPRTPQGEATKYMALSYCWGILDGTSKLLTTTHDTIRSRIENIEVGAMPLAFQDAIAVARKLTIQYIWIDSLCILQDDARDWQTESSKMAEIFSNAYLTLIAAAGSGCNDSFLISRGLPGPSCAIPLKMNHELNVEGEFSLRFRQHHGRGDKMGDIRGSRWITRGWTFQEERLARRALIFGSSKFFLDCRSLERSQDSDRYQSRPAWVASATGNLGEDRVPEPESTATAQVWDDWQTLCSHYSYRELTFPKDKLPAFSGMASRFAKKVHSQYLAGLWRQNLMHDLFWTPVTIMTKPSNYRSPSWSWASLDGRINWPSWNIFRNCIECNTYCTVLDAQTLPVGLDHYGAVQDAFLKIRGVVKDLKLKPTGANRNGVPNVWTLNHEGEAIGESILDMNDDIARLDCGEKKYQALLVAECNLGSASQTRARGLLLEKNGRKRENHDEFERVGTFVLYLSVTLRENSSEAIWNRDGEEVIMIV